MLPPFIIQQIRQREERQRREQPFLELPLENPPLNAPEGDSEADDDPDRGVIILELM